MSAPERPAAVRSSRHGWRVAWAVAVLGASLLVFARLVEDYVTNDPLVRLDVRLNRWLSDETWAPLVAFFELVTISGNTVFLIAVTLTAAVFLRLRGLRRESNLVLFAFVGVEVATLALKYGFERPRPAYREPSLEVDAFSFPSGHASASAAVYGALAIVLSRDARSWRTRVLTLAGATVLIAAIAFSRVYLGAHYFSDVLAGVSVGAAWLMVCVLVLTLVEIHEQRRLGGAPLEVGGEAQAPSAR